MEDTIFMKIIQHEIPAEIVYEDDKTLAFLDIRPNNPGHTLVIPRKPSRNILDTDDETLAAVMRTTKKVAAAVKEAVSADGLNITMNNESAAGQLVFHFHIHIIPRFTNDGLHLWDGKPYKTLEALAEIASAIRARMNS